MSRASVRSARKAPSRPTPAPEAVFRAFERLARSRALQTLVRGALPAAVLKRLLKNALPAQTAREMPDEIWAALAAGMAVESEVFGMPLAQALHDRLAWDREPADLDDWWRLVRERPLEAMWMAALSDDRAVKKELAHVLGHCLENHRSSPDCAPPSWEFVDGLLDVQAQTARELREAERKADDAERRAEAERQRLEELREELKRLRRETAELRAGKAQAERKADDVESRARALAATADAQRIEDLERRLRKAEKEREHFARELERLPPAPSPSAAETTAPAAEEGAAPPFPEPPRPSLSEDPNPRRRILRQILRRLFKKGKIGASHTHEDNVYRGVPDHEKGIAKEAMDLLYREGLLMPKPTAKDPHVSLNPDQTSAIRAIIAGDIANPRLQRFINA